MLLCDRLQYRYISLIRKTMKFTVDILITIFLPLLILSQFAEPYLPNTTTRWVIGLSIPFLYGLVETSRKKQFNYIAFLGLLNVLALGGLRFVPNVTTDWYAARETVIPITLMLFFFISALRKSSRFNNIFYNDQWLNIDKIEFTLEQNGNKNAIKGLLRQCLFLLAFTFFLIAVLNFMLAKTILTSPVESTKFIEQVGILNTLSFPVIVIPACIAIFLTYFRFFFGIKKITGLEFKTIFAENSKQG